LNSIPAAQRASPFYQKRSSMIRIITANLNGPRPASGKGLFNPVHSRLTVDYVLVL
jgi:hypothetical protein